LAFSSALRYDHSMDPSYFRALMALGFFLWLFTTCIGMLHEYIYYLYACICHLLVYFPTFDIVAVVEKIMNKIEEYTDVSQNIICLLSLISPISLMSLT